MSDQEIQRALAYYDARSLHQEASVFFLVACYWGLFLVVVGDVSALKSSLV